jgi:hypothetical protein
VSSLLSEKLNFGSRIVRGSVARSEFQGMKAA